MGSGNRLIAGDAAFATENASSNIDAESKARRSATRIRKAASAGKATLTWDQTAVERHALHPGIWYGKSAAKGFASIFGPTDAIRWFALPNHGNPLAGC